MTLESEAEHILRHAYFHADNVQSVDGVRWIEFEAFWRSKRQFMTMATRDLVHHLKSIYKGDGSPKFLFYHEWCPPPRDNQYDTWTACP